MGGGGGKWLIGLAAHIIFSRQTHLERIYFINQIEYHDYLFELALKKKCIVKINKSSITNDKIEYKVSSLRYHILVSILKVWLCLQILVLLQDCRLEL